MTLKHVLVGLTVAATIGIVGCTVVDKGEKGETMESYQNPLAVDDVWDGYGIGDPFIMKFNGLYYMYSSTKDGDKGIKAFQSRDLLNWESIGYVTEVDETFNAYAPEVIYDNGYFYMVTSPGGHGHYTLRASAPEGPFELMTDNYGRWIDGSLFMDEDGSMYFTNASPQGIEVTPTEDGMTYGETRLTEAYLNYWTEGPMIIKKNQLYYLTYTGNHLDSEGYRVNYAVSDTTPMGPYKVIKEEPILINTDEDYRGLGHSATFVGPDLLSYYMVYHHSTYDQGPRVRYMNIERLFFNGTRMSVGETFKGLQPLWNRPDSEGFNGDDPAYTVEEASHLLGDIGAGDYAAELNVYPNKDISLILGRADERKMVLGSFSRDQFLVYTLEGETEEVLLQYTLPADYNRDVLHTLRVDYKDKTMVLHMDALLMGDIVQEGLHGQIGYQGDAQGIGYCAANGGTTESVDKAAYKPIPGDIDSVLALDTDGSVVGVSELTGFESGMSQGYEVLTLKDKEEGTYAVNILEEGSYRFYVDAFEPIEDGWMKGKIGRASFEWHVEQGEMDDNGLRRYVSQPVKLKKGYQTLTLSHKKGAPIHMVSFGGIKVPDESIAYTHSLQEIPLRNAQFLGEYQLVKIDDNGLKTGNISDEKIMIGDKEWDNYKMSIRMEYTDIPKDGRLGLLIRSTMESYHKDQVKEAALGYFVEIKGEQIVLNKWTYGEKMLAASAYTFEAGKTYTIEVEAIGNKINVSIDGDVLLTYDDPTPYLTGRVGIWSDKATAIFTDLQVTKP